MTITGQRKLLREQEIAFFHEPRTALGRAGGAARRKIRNESKIGQGRVKQGLDTNLVYLFSAIRPQIHFYVMKLNFITCVFQEKSIFMNYIVTYRMLFVSRDILDRVVGDITARPTYLRHVSHLPCARRQAPAGSGGRETGISRFSDSY